MGSAYRATLDGRRFTSKSQLAEILEEASFQVVADYVTAYGSPDEFSANAGDSGLVVMPPFD